MSFMMNKAGRKFVEGLKGAKENIYEFDRYEK